MSWRKWSHCNAAFPPCWGPGRSLWPWNVGWRTARSSCPSPRLVFTASYLEEQDLPKRSGRCFAGREKWDLVTLVMVKIKLFWNVLPRSPCAMSKWPSNVSCSARKPGIVRLFFFAAWRQTSNSDESISIQSPPEVLYFGHPYPEAMLVKCWKGSWIPVL